MNAQALYMDRSAIGYTVVLMWSAALGGFSRPTLVPGSKLAVKQSGVIHLHLNPERIRSRGNSFHMVVTAQF